MHPFWFSPSTRAAIGPKTHLAHPPSIPWPCATTPTPLQSTLSRFFMVSPVKTGTHSKIFEFSPLGALGMHPYHPLHLPTTPSPGATTCTHVCTLLCHLRTLPCCQHTFCALLHTPSHTFAHPCTLLCAPFPGLATHIWLSINLGPLWLPWATHPQHNQAQCPHQTSVESSPNHPAPIWAILFAVGWLIPLSHPRTLSSRVTIAKAASLLTAVSPVAGPHTSLSHGPWVGNFFLLGKSLIVVPRGLRGLGPKGGIGVLGYPSLHMTHPLH